MRCSDICNTCLCTLIGTRLLERPDIFSFLNNPKRIYCKLLDILAHTESDTHMMEMSSTLEPWVTQKKNVFSKMQ